MSTLVVRGQFWINEGVLQPGHATITHCHVFDHITWLMQPGRVEALGFIEGKDPSEFPVVRFIDKPRGGWVLITANTWHRIINTGTGALDYYCSFVPRDSETGAVATDGMNGWMGAIA